MSNLSKPDLYWEKAGEVGFAKAMHKSGTVASHILEKSWNTTLEIAAELGVPPTASVLDLGCGDGDFTNSVLSHVYRQAYGVDKAEAAIQRAKEFAPSNNVHFDPANITTINHTDYKTFDCAFLIGILHHVKWATPHIMKELAYIAPKVVILEPNGNHLLRKGLELTKAYRDAGEDSFRVNELRSIFIHAGYQVQIQKRINLFPNMTPEVLFRIFQPLENWMEKTQMMNFLLTVNMFGLTVAHS